MRSAACIVLGAIGIFVGCEAKAGRGSMLPGESTPITLLAAAPMPRDVRERAPPSLSTVKIAVATMDVLDAAWRSHDASKLGSAYTVDARIVFPGRPDAIGRAAIEEEARSFWAAFPDAKHAWSRVWRAPGVAIVESAWTGTNAGAFLGEKPTFKTLGGTALTLTWFAPEGLVREQHIYSDAASVAVQLGLTQAVGHEKLRPFEGLPTSREEHVSNGTVVEQENVDLVKAGFLCLAKRDSKGFFSWIADDVEYVDFTQNGSWKGKSGSEKWFRALTSRSPDVEVAANVWGIEDFVIREYGANGSRPSDGAEVFQIQDGKLARGWGYSNGPLNGPHAR